MKTPFEELIEKWESEMGSYIPNAPIYRAFIEEAKSYLEKENKYIENLPKKVVKYRVKFKCYYYNTGMGDNHYYDRNEDFNTLEEAIIFKEKVDRADESIEIDNGYIAGVGVLYEFYPEKEVLLK